MLVEFLCDLTLVPTSKTPWRPYPLLLCYLLLARDNFLSLLGQKENSWWKLICRPSNLKCRATLWSKGRLILDELLVGGVFLSHWFILLWRLSCTPPTLPTHWPHSPGEVLGMILCSNCRVSSASKARTVIWTLDTWAELFLTFIFWNTCIIVIYLAFTLKNVKNEE